MAGNEMHGIGHTANDEFKRGYGNWLWVGLIAAVIAHFGLFILVPQFRAADLRVAGDEVEVIDLPPEVEIPPPPQQIARPATPRVATVELDEDITIAPTTFETNPVENLPPPPTTGSAADRPSFIPYDQPPVLRNRSQVEQLLQRYYPRNLRDAGIGGTVELWIYVTSEGSVERSVVRTSSGHPALDSAAQQVAANMQFQPAMNRDRVTDVWVSQNITFTVQ